MSMLSRYRKSGGFKQLLMLIETCGKQKQENFLKLIEAEDAKWAEAVKTKMLSIPKILAWDAEVLAEIFSRVQELTLATAMHGFTEEEWKKISSTFSHSQIRKLEDLKSEKEPNPAEITAAYLKILTDVRQLIADGHIRIEKFAPELVVEEGIEEKMGKGEGLSIAPEPSSSGISNSYTEPPANGESLNFDGPKAAPAGPPVTANSPEMKQMYRKMQHMHEENIRLKTENKLLKEKILNIRKMTAA